MLWLVGKEYSSDSFRKECSQSNTNLLYGLAPLHCTNFSQSHTNLFCRSAPLPSMWTYRQKEREEDRKLELNEYSPTFVRWAQCCLQYNLASIIEACGSLADLLIQKITGRQSATHLEIQAAKREEKRQKLIEQASEPVNLESIHGKQVHLVPQGKVSIRRSAPLKPLMFRLTIEKAKEILELKETPRVRLTLEALHLCVNEAIVYKRPIDRLLMLG